MLVGKYFAADWGDGNYLDSPAGSRDSLWDIIGDKSEEIKQSVSEWFSELWQTTILFIDKMSFWVACLGCVYNIWLYAATHDRKYSSRITVIILSYIFVQMIVKVLEK